MSNAIASSLDYLPTFLSLAGVTLPTDRVYDGIDLAPVLFKASEDGHTSLFHPNSGTKGSVDGALDGVRLNNWKAIYQTGGAADCAGNLGTIAHHDPPLLLVKVTASTVHHESAQERRRTPSVSTRGASLYLC